MVSLSRPAFAATPSTSPSITPGLTTGSGRRHAAAIASASVTKRRRSTPITAAGTRPNGDSAEKRPPICGIAEEDAAEPVRLGDLLHLRAGVGDGDEVLPDLVGARPTCAMRSKKYCLKTLGSSVLPDLLATMTSVRARSTRASRLATWAGSVESSTCRSGAPCDVPEGHPDHFGAQARPAHPQQQRVREAFSARSPSRTPCSSSERAARGLSGASSHPSQRSSPALVHTLASRSHSRATRPLDCHSRASRSTCSRSGDGSVTR